MPILLGLKFNFEFASTKAFEASYKQKSYSYLNSRSQIRPRDLKNPEAAYPPPKKNKITALQRWIPVHYGTYL